MRMLRATHSSYVLAPSRWSHDRGCETLSVYTDTYRKLSRQIHRLPGGRARGARRDDGKRGFGEYDGVRNNG